MINITENFRKFQQDYRFGYNAIKNKPLLKLEQNLIKINPEKNYFSAKNNLNSPELPKGYYKSFLSGLLKKNQIRYLAKN